MISKPHTVIPELKKEEKEKKKKLQFRANPTRCIVQT